MKYYSYGWVYVLAENSGAKIAATAQVQHDALQGSYQERVKTQTDYYNADGSLRSVKLHTPAYNNVLLSASDLDVVETPDPNNPGGTCKTYYRKERYPLYKDGGPWEVTARAFDDTHTQAGDPGYPIQIRKYDLK